ncbi:MAG: substrate-binding periplasmic protein [Gaiellaceae bacterium]
MKGLLAAAVLAALVAVPAATAKRASAPTLQSGKLIVAFGDPAVGFASGTVRGSTITNPRGYEVDLAKDIAKGLGVTPSWMYTSWNGLFLPGTKKFDISFQEATITAQRGRTVTFSSPYMNANQGVLISKRTTPPKSIADLKKLQTCAQTNTTGLDWINSVLKPSTRPLTYPTTTAAFQAVQLNQCQAIVLDVPIVALERKSNPTKFGPVAGQIVTHEQYGAVMQKGSKLAPLIDAQIKKLTANGTIAKLQKKWFNLNFGAIPVLK